MDVATLIISVLALVAPVAAVVISHQKLRPEVAKLSKEVENLSHQNEVLRAEERKRLRAHADQVDITILGFEPGCDDGMHEHDWRVSMYFPRHPDPLNVLLARVMNRGPYPIRDLFVAAGHYVPARASMNGEDPEFRVRRVPSELVPLSSGAGAVFAFSAPGAQTELDRLAVWFSDEEGRRWKKDIYGIAALQGE